MFKSVMFELAQTWTPGTNPGKYAAFLRDLLAAVTEEDDTVSGGGRVFRQDSDITPGDGQPSLFLSATNLEELFD